MNWDELREIMDSIRPRWGIPACECAVTIAHERVFYHSDGYSDVSHTRPASEGDLYWIYSLSKLFTCTAALQLIERGLLGLDDSVARYLPSWTHLTVRKSDEIIPCGTPPTIFQLMTMTAGLNYNLDVPAIVSLREETRDRCSLQQIVDALASEPLDFFPGEHFRYSLSHDVLGAIIERVSGMQLADYMNVYIKEPLGAADMTFFPSTEQLARFSTQYHYIEKTNSFVEENLKNHFALSSKYASGGAGLCSGISDVSLLTNALANKGLASTGRRILSEKSVQMMASDSLNPTQKADFSLMRTAPYSYGLGVRTLTESAWGIPKGEFGWDGAAGAYTVIDPDLHVSLVYLQHVHQHYGCTKNLHNELRDALYRIILRG